MRVRTGVKTAVVEDYHFFSCSCSSSSSCYLVLVLVPVFLSSFFELFFLNFVWLVDVTYRG